MFCCESPWCLKHGALQVLSHHQPDIKCHISGRYVSTAGRPTLYGAVLSRLMPLPFQKPDLPSLSSTPKATSNMVSCRLCSTISSLMRSSGAILVLETTADSAPHNKCLDQPAAVCRPPDALSLTSAGCNLLSGLLFLKDWKRLAKHGCC